MRIAFSNIAWTAAQDADTYAVLAAARIRGLELAPTRVWAEPLAAADEDVAAFVAGCAAHGIAPVAMQSLLYGRPDLQLFGDEASRDGVHRHVVGMMDLAVRLGVGRLVFGSPGNRVRGERSLGEATDIAADALARLAEEASVRGVVVCLEANPVEYGCDFLTTIDEAAAMVRAVDRPGLRLNLDTGCMRMAGDDALAAVARHGDLVAHVHVSSPRLAPVPFGTRSSHADLADALRGLGYGGWVSVEMRAVDEGDGVEAVRRAAAFVGEVYR